MRAAQTVKYQHVIHATEILVNAVPFLGANPEQADYKEALKLVEYLLEHNEDSPLIDLLATRIARYEDTAAEFTDFNARIAAIPQELAMLRTLMDQYGLNQSSFQQEIGSRSLVSMIMNGQRALTLDHMRALSARFNIPISAFING